MKKNLLQHSSWQLLTMLLVLPTFYFIVSALLNFNLGITSLWKLIEPIFNDPFNGRPGLNINLLILSGPIVSLFLSVFRLVECEVNSDAESFEVNAKIKRHSWSWVSLSLAAFCLAAMFLYFLGENCNCH